MQIWQQQEGLCPWITPSCEVANTYKIHAWLKTKAFKFRQTLCVTGSENMKYEILYENSVRLGLNATFLK